MTEQRPLRDEWDANAEDWVAWARKPGHDSYWQFHRDEFRELLPAPPAHTLDVGCGEGRFPRDLKSWGYSVVGVDGSETMIRHARQADPAGEYHVADAAQLPFPDESFPLVTAFMSLQDVDDLRAAAAEFSRVLCAGGFLCVAITHPFQSAGEFDSNEPDARFVMSGSYFEERRVGGKPYIRDGMSMTFHSVHRSLGTYVSVFNDVGLALDRLRELGDLSDPPGTRWRRMPLFLDFRAAKSG